LASLETEVDLAQSEVADTGQRKSEKQLKWRTSTAASTINIASNTSEVKIERLAALLLILYSKLQF